MIFIFIKLYTVLMYVYFIPQSVIIQINISNKIKSFLGKYKNVYVQRPKLFGPWKIRISKIP